MRLLFAVAVLAGVGVGRPAARRKGVRATVRLHVTVAGRRWPGRTAWTITLRS